MGTRVSDREENVRLYSLVALSQLASGANQTVVPPSPALPPLATPKVTAGSAAPSPLLMPASTPSSSPPLSSMSRSISSSMPPLSIGAAATPLVASSTSSSVSTLMESEHAILLAANVPRCLIECLRYARSYTLILLTLHSLLNLLGADPSASYTSIPSSVPPTLTKVASTTNGTSTSVTIATATDTLPMDDRDLALRAVLAADGKAVMEQCHQRLTDEWKAKQLNNTATAAGGGASIETKRILNAKDKDEQYNDDENDDHDDDDDGSGDNKTAELLTLLEQLRLRMALPAASTL
jgi:hypothetical protein